MSNQVCPRKVLQDLPLQLAWYRAGICKHCLRHKNLHHEATDLIGLRASISQDCVTVLRKRAHGEGQAHKYGMPVENGSCVIRRLALLH